MGVDPETHSPVMFLQDKASGRGIPIWIGTTEARAIQMELEHIDAPRPLTHQLLKNMLDRLEAKVERVIIEDLKDSTYYASIVVKAGRKHLTIDSRPSDAVALALKCEAPLFISEALVKKGLLIDLEAGASHREITDIYGFYYQDVTQSVARYFELPETKGVIVTDTEPGGPAEEAGIMKGDVVLRVGRQRVEDSGTLEKELSGREPSDPVRLEILRMGKRVTCNLVVKEEEEPASGKGG